MATTDSGPTLECHLSPPMGSDEPLALADDELSLDPEFRGFDHVEVAVDLAGPRYPTVASYDWCAGWVGVDGVEVERRITVRNGGGTASSLDETITSRIQTPHQEER